MGKYLYCVLGPNRLIYLYRVGPKFREVTSMIDYTNFLNCFDYPQGFKIPVEVEEALGEVFNYFISGKQTANKANGAVYVRAIPQAIHEGLMYGWGSTDIAKMEDSLKIQILYIVNNATGWRGEEARKGKKVLNEYATNR